MPYDTMTGMDDTQGQDQGGDAVLQKLQDAQQAIQDAIDAYNGAAQQEQPPAGGAETGQAGAGYRGGPKRPMGPGLAIILGRTGGVGDDKKRKAMLASMHNKGI